VEASDFLAKQFLPLIQAFTKTETDEMSMQLLFLKKVAEIQPEVHWKLFKFTGKILQNHLNFIHIYHHNLSKIFLQS
jgi:hypothetical protein